MLNKTIVFFTFRGFVRDRVLQGMLAPTAMFALIPVFATLSMRQIQEFSITLSLSLTSFILLLLSVFLGSTTIYRDVDRRFILSVLSLPITRTEYFFSRFTGVAFFLLFASLLLLCSTLAAVSATGGNPTLSRPLAWDAIMLAVWYDFMKYTLIAAFAFLFSSFSTSFFLPFFGAICIYLLGTASQEVYDFVQSPSSVTLSPWLKDIASALYYILPNLSAFDLKVHAVYGVPYSSTTLLFTAGYWLVSLGIVLASALVIFNRRQFS